MAKDSKSTKKPTVQKPVPKTTQTKKTIKNTKKTQPNTAKVKVIETIIQTPELEIKDIAADVTIVDRPAFSLIKPENVSKLIALIVALIAIGGTIFVTGVYIPKYVLSETDEAKALRQKQETETKSQEALVKAKQQVLDENSRLKFIDQSVVMNINDFGDLNIALKDKAAPKTVENFIRLTDRGYYNNTIFHRIVKAADFSVIQGGDPNGTGSGGATADGNKLVDELWKVRPEFDLDATTGQKGETKNTPIFSDPDLYVDYQPGTGQVTYRRGLILMAKTAEADSATSQFFITLNTTTLPAEYTVFGVITEESLQVLDKINNEVNPIVTPDQTGSAPQSQDGQPDKELRISTVKIMN